MSYTPPAYNAINVDLTTGYTPPAHNAINVDLAAGAVTPSLTPVRMVLEQSLALLDGQRVALEQAFALKERQTLHQVFRDADQVRKVLWHIFRDAGQVRRVWHQRFGDAVRVRAMLEQVFALPELVRMVLHQDFAVTSDVLRAVTHQNWSIQDVEVLRQTVYQVFGLLGAQGELLQYTVICTVDGVVVDNPSMINIERDIDLYYIDVSLRVSGQHNYVLYAYGSEVEITINDVVFVLLVTEVRRDRQHGSGNYYVDARSPAVLLGQGYASTVDGELTGMASQIAAGLAPDFIIDWQIHDEFYAPGELIAAGEYPIELIANMAAAMGGVVQSLPDGSLQVIYRRPTRVDQLADAAPDHVLSRADDCASAGDTPDRRDGYNVYQVGNQAEADDTLRMEEESISKWVKEIRGYQTPWTGNFDLTHTGGDWVVIEPMGVEERTETEVVEFVAGVGQTAYPIYSWSDLEWQQTNLGTITFSEDGSLESTVAGESLLSLTYTTKCKLWKVSDTKDEQLQLVTQEVET